MFIRKTHHKKKKTGGHYYTYRIVESQRIGTKVQQRTLLNLGSYFSLPVEQWPVLCKRITELLYGQQSLLNIECNIDKLAYNCVARILAKNEEDQQVSPDYRAVNLDSLKTYRSRSIGCEHVVLEALRTLELDAKLTLLGFNGIRHAAQTQSSHRAPPVQKGM